LEKRKDYHRGSSGAAEGTVTLCWEKNIHHRGHGEQREKMGREKKEGA
jgi:hypothetical protein